MQQTTQVMKENPMRTLKIEKITLNIGTGMPGDKLEKALKLLGSEKEWSGNYTLKTGQKIKPEILFKKIDSIEKGQHCCV